MISTSDDQNISPTTAHAPHRLVHSPTSVLSLPSQPSQLSQQTNPSKRESHRFSELASFRRELGALESIGTDFSINTFSTPNSNTSRIPQIQHNPPTAIPGSSSQVPPWMSSSNPGQQQPSGSGNGLSTSTFFNNDSSDNLSSTSQLSPGFRASSRADQASIGSGSRIDLTSDSPDIDFHLDDCRRPSVASIATASSQGSAMTRGGFKKLQGFFGEEFPGRDSFEASAPPGSRDSRSRSFSQGRLHRDRNHSNATDHTRDASPSSSRPRTPVPARPEVVPFLYQDQEDIARYGEAPVRDVMVRDALPGSDRERFMSDSMVQIPPKTSSSNRSGHHGHRHNRSNDDPRALRPTTSRDEASGSQSGRDRSARDRGGSAATIYSNPTRSRAQSPAPGQPFGKDGPGSPSNNQTKRGGVFRRLIHGKSKEDKDSGSSRHLSTSMSNRSITHKTSRQDITRGQISPSYAASYYHPSAASSTMVFSSADMFDPQGRQQQAAFANKFPFAKRPRTARTYDEESIGPTDHRKGGMGTAYWLDTDLRDMSGVLTQDGTVMLRNDAFPRDKNANLRRPTAGSVGSMDDQLAGTGSWNAPDSWGVRRTTEEGGGKEAELDDLTVRSYCIRIFRGDGTFATLSMPLNSTVSEVIGQLIKKMYSAESAENYHIILKTHDLFRILGPNERLLLLQKKLLEQAGYSERDRIPDIGREDNSYLCRFMFLSSVDQLFSKSGIDPALMRIQKPAHVDLSGRNLATIPIPLFKRTEDIVSLNVSRNLALELPRDFIGACTSLRDIKFNNNDARRLPPSFGHAPVLSSLDAANNFIESLEDAELENVRNVLNMSFANNRLTSLPSYFINYQMLRYLNLSSNMLTEFPDFLCELSSLLYLDISFNAIKKLPESMGKMKTLSRFLITNNGLDQPLPESMKEMESLQELDVKYNLIDNIQILAEIPNLEVLSADHNQISRFSGHFPALRSLRLNSNPLTVFELTAPVPTLKVLNLSNGNLSSIDGSYGQMPNLEYLIMDRNWVTQLPPQISQLKNLVDLKLSCNNLSTLPPQLGCLTNLKKLDVHSNNLRRLPGELWYANSLEELNVSSNLLETFPDPANKPPKPFEDNLGPPTLPHKSVSQPSLATFNREDLLEEARRPSQASTLLSVGQVPVSPGAERKGSVVSVYGKGRNTKVISRNPSQATLATVSSRKDASWQQREKNTFAGSLRLLYLADNNLEDDVLSPLSHCTKLQLLNLSYNDLEDMSLRAMSKWPNLLQLYLSRNQLTTLSLPNFEPKPEGDIIPLPAQSPPNPLRVLFLNGNKFTNPPSDISLATKLTFLDCGSNWLKYNVCNVPYDWNWNYNTGLKYLNLSGNKRLEIKKTGVLDGRVMMQNEEVEITGFSRLTNLRILGLMDVTLTVPSVPDQSEDRRVRTAGSRAGHLRYGMADTLGRSEHLSTMDLIVPRFNSNDSEVLVGLFDGQTLSTGGSKVSKYLHENFGHIFASELRTTLQRKTDTVADALRRSFLTLNRDLINVAIQTSEDRPVAAHRTSTSQALVLSPEDLKSGACATVAYLQDDTLWVANVGDVQALLVTESNFRMLTHKHDPAEESERQRIREAGGWVSRSGKLNDMINVSRAFGFHELMPAVMASPHVSEVKISDTDDVLIIATSDLWEYLDMKLVADIYRSEAHDLMLASQKLRDLAMAHGATEKLMVMMISISDLKRAQARARLTRGQSMSRYPSGIPEDFQKRARKAKGAIGDSSLQRLGAEIPAPTGIVAIVFTDIKNSTTLWELYPMAMRTGIKLHNEVMRRLLRRIGGYEVKTEGDAFMVSFPTATSALLWCFAVQHELLEVQWPGEVIHSPSGRAIFDDEGKTIFKGLSVRMGIHFGECVSEPDPVTRRMDYFGPMVNKAARVSGVADGGQITVSSDFIQELQRCLETLNDPRSLMISSDDSPFEDDTYAANIYKDLRSLTLQGFEVKEMGERKLKGLENPETIYSMYPRALKGRIEHHELHEKQQAEPTPTPFTVMSSAAGGELPFDPEAIWQLWHTCLRLEMINNALENAYPGARLSLMEAETAILTRYRKRGGEFGEAVMLAFLSQLVSRVESAVTSLTIRHLTIGQGPMGGLGDLAGPMGGMLEGIAERLREAEKLRKVYGELLEVEGEEDEEDGYSYVSAP